MKKWIIGIVVLIGLSAFISTRLENYQIDSDEQGLLLSQDTAEIDRNFVSHEPFMGTIIGIEKDENKFPISFTLLDGQSFTLVNAEEFAFTYEELNPLQVGVDAIVTPINNTSAYIRIINDGDDFADLKYALSINTEHIILSADQLEEHYELQEGSLENGIGCYYLLGEDPMLIVLMQGQGDFLSKIDDRLPFKGDEIAIMYHQGDVTLLSITSNALYEQLQPYYKALLTSFDESVQTMDINQWRSK